MASTLLIAHYVKFERSYERFYSNAENIYRLSLDLYNGAEFEVNDVETYQTLGPEFKEKMPEVIDYARFMHLGTSEVYVPSTNSRNYEHKIYFADPSAFTLFDYPLLYGEPKKPFEEPYKVVINATIAQKYFGRTNVLGETFEIGLVKTPLEVVGVMSDLPQNTHLKFDILISHATIPQLWDWYEKYTWGANNEYTYLLMDKNAQLEDFNTKIRQYSLESEHLEEEIVIAEHITDIHLYSNKTFEPEVNGSAQTVNFMVIIAIFILVLAWVNYVNLSTSKSLERAREVGVRKVIGSSKHQLLGQFLFDAFIVILLSAILAFTFVQLSIPYFKSITAQDLPTAILYDGYLMLLLAGMVVFGTVLSGLYPALVLSSFKPVQVLKGKFTNSSNGILLRKGLVTFQFLTTVVLLSVSLAVYFQIQFLSETDLGIDIENTLVLRRPANTNSDSIFISRVASFESKLEQNANIKGVTFTGGVPGVELHEIGTNDGILRVGADENESAHNYYLYGVKADYFELMDITFMAGKAFAQDVTGQVVINERAVESLGFESAEEAIGQKITHYWMSDEPSEVVGVFNNFYLRSPKEQHIPMIIYPRPREAHLFVVKSNTPSASALLGTVNQVWSEVFPNNALDYYFLNDQFNHQYETDQRFGRVTLLFTFLSILIASLGLFGLSSFTILQRTKEIGIRKVLGSSVAGIVALLSKDFIKLILLAGVLAIPLAYYLISLWLDNYALQISLEWWLFATPILLILLIAFGTIIGQTIKSALQNPVDSLRYE